MRIAMLRSITSSRRSILPGIVVNACRLAVADPDVREGSKKPKNIQKPKYRADDHDSIQNGLDCSLHWYVSVDQPEQNTHNNQDQHYL
jgi:hypothetical protein